MEWNTVLFNWVWIDATLLVFAVAGGAVLFTSRRAPEVKSGPSFQEISTPLLQEMGDELHVLGFKYYGARLSRVASVRATSLAGASLDAGSGGLTSDTSAQRYSSPSIPCHRSTK